MHNYKITVNTFNRNSFDLSAWNISSDEPERITIRKGNKEFALVFDSTFRLEVWSLDENGEIENLESAFASDESQGVFS